MIPFLQKGDLVYICSPAKAIEPNLVESAAQLYKQNGYKAQISDRATGRQGYFSGSIEERRADLQKGLDHPTARAIICNRGGYGIIQLLELLDWTEFKKNPKWIVGFSDVTNLHLELIKMELPSLHAAMPLNYQENTALSISTMFAALEGKSYSLQASVSPFNKIGKVDGEIIGGNLSILYSLLSRHSSDLFKNKILYIEDLGEFLYVFDRMFTAIQFSGIPKVIKGLIVGSFTNVRDNESVFGETIDEMIHRHFGHLNIPIAYNFPAGHIEDNQAVIIGQKVPFEVGDSGSVIHFNKNPAI